MLKKTVILAAFLITCPFKVDAQTICPLDSTAFKPKTVASLENFKKLPILRNGRVKPIDTYAQNILLQFSGLRTFDKKNAVNWLARHVFAPQQTRTDKVFLINNPSIAEALGIAPEKKRRYSFAQLEGQLERLTQLARNAHQIDQKDRDIVESEIIRLFENVRLYTDLSLSFAFAFPHPDFSVMENENLSQLELRENAGQASFLDIALQADQLHVLTEPLQKIDSQQWSDSQKEVVKLISNLFGWSNIYHHLPFHIIPSYTSHSEEWLSPWDAIALGFKNELGRKETILLRDMLVAYWNGQQIDFDIATRAFRASVEDRLSLRDRTSTKRLNLELTYNKLNLFFYAKALYLLTTFLFLVFLIIKKKIIHRLGLLFVTTGFVMHVCAMIMRINILQRPPVSTLYETFIFVGFVCVLSGIIIERVNKNWVGLVVSSIAGFAFLTMASKFSAEGDTMKMLVAVLNSNFWLGTHVLSITTGYAGVCVAGLVGHIYILQSIFNPGKKTLLNSTYKILIGTLGFGLIMTFLGTNLGGIWADESWGRFWGWDPKENGALMIVLWVALLFHARVGKFIGPLGLAGGSILGIIVVMWAWFGVNLLSVGLHSYGFTSGLAFNLALYVLLQLAFLIITIPLAKRKLRHD